MIAIGVKAMSAERHRAQDSWLQANMRSGYIIHLSFVVGLSMCSYFAYSSLPSLGQALCLAAFAVASAPLWAPPVILTLNGSQNRIGAKSASAPRKARTDAILALARLEGTPVEWHRTIQVSRAIACQNGWWFGPSAGSVSLALCSLEEKGASSRVAGSLMKGVATCIWNIG